MQKTPLVPCLLLCGVLLGGVVSCEPPGPTGIDTYFCHSEAGMCSSELIALIDSATTTLECAVYTFTLESVAQALADARNRGVEVWVVYEEDQENVDVLAILQSAEVYVRHDGNPNLMHHKFMVLDGHTVVTGSYNWTYSADNKHDENLQIIRSIPAAELFQQEFQRLWTEGSG